MFNIMYQTTKQLQQWKPLEQRKNSENMWKRWTTLHKAPSLDESSMKLSSFVGVVKTTIKPTFEWMINTQKIRSPEINQRL